MIIAAALCPQPPMLVPELAAGAVLDLAAVRAACDAAVAAVRSAEPDEILVLGIGVRRHWWAPGDHGSFAGYGVDLPVAFGGGGGARFDDLSMLVGAWLLGRAGSAQGRVSGLTVPADTPPVDCVALGRQLVERSARRRLGLVVMGDASARRARAEPGAPDPAAEEFDAAATTALRSGHPAALAGLDATAAAAVHADCRAPWQVFAGTLTGRQCVADVTYAATPLEVTYLVATWHPR